ncbi:MAG TPA: AsmA family protein [Thermodesulfobacteriota bacterium]|nr:AsmA family protein [Thermodesulfobacteriota bacterium]
MKRCRLCVSIIIALILVLFIVLYVLVSRYDFNTLKPRISQKVEEATGRKLILGGDIKLKIGLTPSLVVDNVSFQNAPWGSQPEMITAKRFEVKVAILPLLRGNIEVKRFILIEPHILLETDATGKSNLTFEAPKERGGEKTKKTPPQEGEIKLPALTLNQVEIKTGSFTYKNYQTKKTHAIKIDNFHLKEENASSPITLKIKGAYGKEVFEVAGILGPLANVFGVDQPWPVDLKAKTKWLNLDIQGEIQNVKTQPKVDLNVQVQGDDFGKVAQVAGTTMSIKGPFEITAHLQTTKLKEYHLSSLKAKISESDLSGSASINLSNHRPLLTGDLSSKNLDLRVFFPLSPASQEKKEPSQGKKQREAKVFPRDPLPLEGLNKVDATLNISFDKVLLPHVAVNKLAVGATLKNGGLVLKPINARIGGGNLGGWLDLRAQQKSLSFTTALEIHQLNLGQMLKDLKATETLDGILNMKLNLKSSGNSVAALMGDLDGVMIAMMSNGRIQNKYLNLLGGDLSSSLFRIINPGGEKEQYTDINCVVNRFDFHRGLGDCTVLACDTKRMTLIGEGTISLKTEEINIALNPMPKEGIESGKGKVSLSLSELAKPFTLGGTLAHPSLKVDAKRAAMTFGKGLRGGILFGPMGVASSLLTSKTAEDNLCLTATEAAKKGIKLSDLQKSSEEKGVLSQTKEGIKSKAQDVGSSFKELFGR